MDARPETQNRPISLESIGITRSHDNFIFNFDKGNPESTRSVQVPPEEQENPLAIARRILEAMTTSHDPSENSPPWAYILEARDFKTLKEEKPGEFARYLEIILYIAHREQQLKTHAELARERQNRQEDAIAMQAVLLGKVELPDGKIAEISRLKEDPRRGIVRILNAAGKMVRLMTADL